MHRRVPGIGHPWLLVDHRQPPDAAPGGCKMVKPRHRAIVDVEAEPALRQSAERKTHRRLDGAAMADDDHVPARLRLGDALDRVAGAVVEIHETFAAGRGLVDGGEPVAAGRTARQKFRAIHALPLAEMLFGERRLARHARGLWKSGGPDGFSRLVGPLQIARIPHRIARQDFRDRLEHLRVAAVALDVGLTVDIATIAAHRRMANPPPTRDYHGRLVAIGHGQNPLLVSSRVATSVVLRQSTRHLQVTLMFEILFEIPLRGKHRVQEAAGRNSWAASRANLS
jgi:hypothetical protein